MSSSAAAEASFIETSKRGACLTLTLNRPKALNSLTLPMVRDLYSAFEKDVADPSIKCILLEGAGGKAFCAGGDVRAVCNAAKELAESGASSAASGEPPMTDAFFREEYALNAAIGGCPKPQVSVWDGIVMGGGVGLSVHGQYRVATEKTMFAMPETNIGLFPDVGGSHFLSRAPGELGTYLGLSGARLGAADVLYAGIATHYVPSAALPELAAALSECGSSEEVAATLSRLSSEPTPGESSSTLEAQRAHIDAAFGGETVEEIMDALGQMSEAGGGVSGGGDPAAAAAFAAETLKTLRKMSPTSMKLTLRLIREARASSSASSSEAEVASPLSACLQREYRVVQRCVTLHKPRGSDDFFEGIRAALIDKDRKPVWAPPTVEEVSDADVDAYFASLGASELALPRLPGFTAP